jgi:hypothetical protein
MASKTRRRVERALPKFSKGRQFRVLTLRCSHIDSFALTKPIRCCQALLLHSSPADPTPALNMNSACLFNPPPVRATSVLKKNTALPDHPRPTDRCLQPGERIYSEETSAYSSPQAVRHQSFTVRPPSLWRTRAVDMRIVSKSTGPLRHVSSDRANTEGFVPFEISCFTERILPGFSKGRQYQFFTLRYSHIDSSVEDYTLLPALTWMETPVHSALDRTHSPC